MSHAGHGMSMASEGSMFGPVDMQYARDFWYALAGCVGILTMIKTANVILIRRRLKAHRRDATSIPSRPTGWILNAYATGTATMREMLYPQPLFFTGRVSKYFSPLPVGKWLLLALYWILILSFVWTDVIIPEGDAMYPFRWEKVGFRAAWVSITQVPFVYLLSCKFNPISLLTGISYERFNWLHRWAARTLWITAIIHWSFFYTPWSIAGIVDRQMAIMSIVRYGFGAWGVMTWMLLSGFGFFRYLSYELFVVQHIAAAGTLLWLLFVHIPSYARYNIWMAVAFLAFDWGVRIIWGIARNTHLLGRSGSKAPGYAAQLEALPGDVVRLTVEDVDFNWQAGQHAYLYMPGLRPFEFHPFTIANRCLDDKKSQKQLSMLIQARSGFSRSLYKAANKSSASSWRQRVFISGPWGTPPNLSHYETVVLIACSTGATFIIPLLQDIVKREGCVKNVTLNWIIKSEEHFSWFEKELREVIAEAENLRTNLRVEVHVTRGSSGVPSNAKEAGVSITSTRDSSSSTSEGSSLTSALLKEDEILPHQHPTTRSVPSLRILQTGRPSLDDMIRSPVEQALGETAVVVCGGMSITAQSRTFVAKLSDERAVHKGTGAQGIYLWTETYGW